MGFGYVRRILGVGKYINFGGGIVEAAVSTKRIS